MRVSNSVRIELFFFFFYNVRPVCLHVGPCARTTCSAASKQSFSEMDSGCCSLSLPVAPTSEWQSVIGRDCAAPPSHANAVNTKAPRVPGLVVQKCPFFFLWNCLWTVKLRREETRGKKWRLTNTHTRTHTHTFAAAALSDARPMINSRLQGLCGRWCRTPPTTAGFKASCDAVALRTLNLEPVNHSSAQATQILLESVLSNILALQPHRTSEVINLD